MALRNMYQPVANGLRTDHPVADLPFVDDAHIPIAQPDEVEAMGRGAGEGRWGRTDRCQGGGWVAYTTDPGRLDLAWVVRWHPEHGRSVLLYRMEDSSSAYMAYLDEALLYRAGGYWWDGVKWYRPAQVFDMSRGDYVHRKVPAALTVSAADLLATGGADPGRGSVISIDQLDLGELRVYRGKAWLDDLALWELRRAADLHAAACVVQVTAPELAADQLLGVTELAEVAGVAASTLRAYIARGENEVPAPQAVVVGGRAMWSRPVAEDWAERRQRSFDGTVGAMSDREHTDLPVGVVEMWNWFTEIFTDTLWTHSDIRKRWALRWRTKPAIREVAHEIGWTAAVNLERIVPISQLAHTLRDALLYKLSDCKSQDPDDNMPTYPITSQVAEVLDWLIRHAPNAASRVVADVVGEAAREHGIPVEKTAASLRQALSLDGKLDDGGYDEFMEIALPPRA